MDIGFSLLVRSILRSAGASPAGANTRNITNGLSAIFFLLLLALPAAAEQKPAILNDVRIDQQLNAQVPPDLEFRDETGKTVRLGDYFDKPTILVLAYYKCPKLCGLVLNGLREGITNLEFNLGQQYQIVTVSFDPRETSELAAKKKRTYIRLYDRPGAEDGWHFLTGDPEPIRRLADAVGFRYAYDEKTEQYVHASGIMLLTPRGRVSKYYLGVQFPARDLRLGIIEASDEKIGTPVDQALLYCFHFDPESGRYTANVMRLVRLGSVATLAAMTLFGLAMWRRERRKKNDPPQEQVGQAFQPDALECQAGKPDLRRADRRSGERLKEDDPPEQPSEAAEQP